MSHRTGRRDLVVYDTRDPDACSEVVKLATDSRRRPAEAEPALIAGDAKEGRER